MNEEHTEDLIRRSEENDTALEKSLITEVIQSNKKNHKTNNILIGFVTVLALLTLGLIYGYFRIQANTEGLAKVSKLCEKDNAEKVGEKTLWDALFNFPPRPDQTIEEKELVIRLQAIVDKNTKPEDCDIP